MTFPCYSLPPKYPFCLRIQVRNKRLWTAYIAQWTTSISCIIVYACSFRRFWKIKNTPKWYWILSIYADRQTLSFHLFMYASCKYCNKNIAICWAARACAIVSVHSCVHTAPSKWCRQSVPCIILHTDCVHACCALSASVRPSGQKYRSIKNMNT